MQSNSKFTQVLLVIIAIVLVIIAVVLIKSNSVHSTIITSQPNENLNLNVQAKPSVAVPAVVKNTTPSPSEEKKYSASYGSFSYKSTAAIIPNRSIGVINIGINENDPYIENVVFFSDIDKVNPFYDNADYQNETIGSNKFESFENTEQGYKHYVLVQGKKGISVTVKTGGPRYVDLSSISF